MERVRKDIIMPEDWEGRMVEMEEQSKAMQNVCKQNRFQVDNQMLQMASNARWTEYRTKNALFARISEVKKLKKTLEQYLTATKHEQQLLKEKLDRCENMEDDLVPLEDAIMHCLQIREEKKSGEAINDNVHKGLIKTGPLIKDLLNCLQNSSLECRKQAESLHKCAFDLENAIDRQEQTLNVDQTQIALEWTSPGVSLKPTQSASSTHQFKMMSKPIWEGFLDDMLVTTDKCLEKSRGLRVEVAANINVVRQELVKQKETVEFALRQIIHTEQQVVEQLQWQENYLRGELKKCERSLDETEKFRVDSVKPLKVTQTRLANRCERPPLELCYDDAQHCLQHQMEFWNETHGLLDHQLHRYRELVHHLEGQLENVTKELQRKLRTLELDKRCLELSNRFQLFQKGPATTASMEKVTSNEQFTTPDRFWQRALVEK